MLVEPLADRVERVGVRAHARQLVPCLMRELERAVRLRLRQHAGEVEPDAGKSCGLRPAAYQDRLGALQGLAGETLPPACDVDAGNPMQRLRHERMIGTERLLPYVQGTLEVVQRFGMPSLRRPTLSTPPQSWIGVLNLASDGISLCASNRASVVLVGKLVSQGP